MNEQKLDEILDNVQERTIIIDVQGSILGPEEDARAFQAVKTEAKAALQALFEDSLREELELIMKLGEIHEDSLLGAIFKGRMKVQLNRKEDV